MLKKHMNSFDICLVSLLPLIEKFRVCQTKKSEEILFASWNNLLTKLEEIRAELFDNINSTTPRCRETEENKVALHEFAKWLKTLMRMLSRYEAGNGGAEFAFRLQCVVAHLLDILVGDDTYPDFVCRNGLYFVTLQQPRPLVPFATALEIEHLHFTTSLSINERESGGLPTRGNWQLVFDTIFEGLSRIENERQKK